MSEVEYKEKKRAYDRVYYEAHKSKYPVARKKWREKNPNYYKEYYEKHKEKFLKYQKQYQRRYFETKENRLKDNARDKVYYALRHGKLTKKPCEICGAIKVEAHHCDYNEPLDVMWLCSKCHKEWHMNNTPIYPQ